MSFRRILDVAAISTVLLCAASAQANEMRALVVGVSDYPNLPKDFQLDGPRNDVVRLRNILLHRGFTPQQITMLADGVSDAALPTRANILAELDRMAKTANKDDVVLLYFAGHGSQEPADRSTPEGRAETDGLYEIFLPRDVGKWSGEEGHVQNALVKTQLRDAVDRILAKGAFVWGVFDSCHSATIVRGGGDERARYRTVDPSALGVPQAAIAAAIRNLPRSRGGADTPETPIAAPAPGSGTGGSVFFYAAQTREATPEKLLPAGHADAKYYGLFGYMIMEALESGAQMTYRQMAQYVLTRYGAINETRVTPLFSGTGLDKPVLLQDAPTVQQWRIERGQEITVQAGALARLTEGTVMAVMADPLAKSDKAIGYLKLGNVGLASSTALPIAYRGKPALKPETMTKGLHARVVEAPPQYGLRVSIDARDCAKDCAPESVIRELRAQKGGIAGTSVTWADAPATGDVMLKLLPDRILLLPPSLQGVDCARSIKECQQVATLMLNRKTENPGRNIEGSLHAIARATNLLRLAADMSTTGRSSSRLDVAMKIRRKNGETAPYDPARVPVLRAGDRIAVTLRNNGLTPLDATLFYVDARYGINVLFPDAAGASNRLEPDASYALEIDINDDTLGLERILAIAVEAQKGQERADFSFLAQSPLEAMRDVKIRGADSDVLAFMDAGFSDFKTRGGGVAPRAPGSRTSMQVFTLNIAK